MQNFPHQYIATTIAGKDEHVSIGSQGLPSLVSAAPAAFGGPGDQWSPETLLVAAVADCFVLTFRAIAQASRLSWNSLSCEVDGTLDQIDRVTQFTKFQVSALLHVPPDTNQERARQLLEKAERACLVVNSLKAKSHLTAVVEVTA